MNSNGKIHDPYCNKDFWLRHLSNKSLEELETCLNNFDQFTLEMENEFRIAMSASRSENCREALVELLRLSNRQATNANQGDLFES